VPEKRRKAPDPVNPVSFNGIRYEVIHFGKARGLKQNGGYLAKFDERTGDETGLIKVYKVKYSWWGGKERDKQDNFITSLELDTIASKLVVYNERGASYSVDLDTERVEILTG
jgi:hypothetical protein